MLTLKPTTAVALPTLSELRLRYLATIPITLGSELIRQAIYERIAQPETDEQILALGSTLE